MYHESKIWMERIAVAPFIDIERGAVVPFIARAVACSLSIGRGAVTPFIAPFIATPFIAIEVARSLALVQNPD